MFLSSPVPPARSARSLDAAHWLSLSAALAVALLLLLPAPAGPPGWLAEQLPDALSSHLDKAVHAALFFALAGIWLRSFERRGASGRPVAAAVLSAAAYGALIEGLQAFAPERTPSLADALANLSGALLLGLVAGRFRREAKRP